MGADGLLRLPAPAKGAPHPSMDDFLPPPGQAAEEGSCAQHYGMSRLKHVRHLSEGHIRVLMFALYVIDVASKTLVPSSASMPHKRKSVKKVTRKVCRFY